MKNKKLGFLPLSIYTESGLIFDWDDAKNLKNIIKHQISFEEALGVFFDPFALYSESQRNGENRQVIIGGCKQGVLFVVFLKKNVRSYRIISARKANKKERKAYEDQW